MTFIGLHLGREGGVNPLIIEMQSIEEKLN
jgi:hypothetical protein